MPLLRFHSPPMSCEQRKIMAEELTPILRRHTHAAGEALILQFVSYPPDHIAQAGHLIQENDEMLYLLECIDFSLPLEARPPLQTALLNQCLELLCLPYREHHRIQLYFLDTLPSLAQKPCLRPV